VVKNDSNQEPLQDPRLLGLITKDLSSKGGTWGERGWRRMMEEMNSSMIYLIHCKNLCKCHNVLLPSIIIIIIIIKKVGLARSRSIQCLCFVVLFHNYSFNALTCCPPSNFLFSFCSWVKIWRFSCCSFCCSARHFNTRPCNLSTSTCRVLHAQVEVAFPAHGTAGFSRGG
jgi:hypothetical protein